METLKNCSNVSKDILLWLIRKDDGRYYIERRINRYGTTSFFFVVSPEIAKDIQEMTAEDAWLKMETIAMTRCS